MVAQRQWPEERTPLDQRCLTIEGHVSETSLDLVRAALPLERPENSAILFLSYAFADIPIGRRYKILFPKDHPALAVSTECDILAVTQQFAKPLDCIPHGWKTICLVRFLAVIPEMIRALPTVDAWTFHPLLCLCDEETRMVHLKGR